MAWASRCAFAVREGSNRRPISIECRSVAVKGSADVAFEAHFGVGCRAPGVGNPDPWEVGRKSIPICGVPTANPIQLTEARKSGDNQQDGGCLQIDLVLRD